MCIDGYGTTSKLRQINVDYSLEAHLEAISDSLGNLSLSCSHHGTGHSPPIPDQRPQSESRSSSEGAGRTLLRKNNRSPRNASFDRLGVGAQFDNGDTKRHEQSDATEFDFPVDIDQPKTGLLERVIDDVPTNFYPHSGTYDIEEWIEHLPVPMRYSSILRLHQFDFQDPAIELSSTSVVDIQHAHGTGGSECFEAPGTKPRVFQRSGRNLDALQSLIVSREISMCDSHFEEEPSPKSPSLLRSTTDASNQPRLDESDAHEGGYDETLQMYGVDELLLEPRWYFGTLPPCPIPPVPLWPLPQCSNSLPKLPNLSTSEVQEALQLSIGPDRERKASLTSPRENTKRTRSAGAWGSYIGFSDTGSSVSEVQEALQISIGPDRKRKASLTSPRRNTKRTGSVSAWGSDINSSNASSVVSDMSGCSHASWAGRKGRRRLQTVVTSGRKPIPNQRYQCTWCLVKFAKKYDWRRHEESQHAPQTEWICMPEGAQITEAGQTYCLFCKIPDPDHIHLTQGHGISSCLERSLKDRKYDRKDHLVQHLSRWHGIIVANNPFLAGAISEWQRRIHAPELEPLWDCGFCEARGMVWHERYTHVAGHMERGLNMISWQQPEIYFCTRSRCAQKFPNHMSWRTHEETVHEHDLDLRACEKQGTLNPAMRCGRIFTSKEAMTRHHLADHKTSDTGRVIHIPCPGSDCPYDSEYNTFWCGFCRTIRSTHGTPHDKNDRFDHIEKNHFGPRRGIKSWHAIGALDRHLLTNAISAIIKRVERGSDEKSEICKYRLATLRQWCRTRQ